MSINIKVLVTEFKNMNSKLVSTKAAFEDHAKESIDFRDKVSKMWFLMTQMFPWALAFIFGSYAGVDILKGFFNKIYL